MAEGVDGDGRTLPHGDAGEPFEAIGGQFEEELLPLYVDGQE